MKTTFKKTPEEENRYELNAKIEAAIFFGDVMMDDGGEWLACRKKNKTTKNEGPPCYRGSLQLNEQKLQLSASLILSHLALKGCVRAEGVFRNQTPLHQFLPSYLANYSQTFILLLYIKLTQIPLICFNAPLTHASFYSL